MRVLKIGGNELSDASFLAGLAQAVAQMVQHEPVVIVHGGGRAIADLSTKLGIASRKVAGLRVTGSALLDVVEMVLSGKSNKLLVRALLAQGVEALGISGVDAHLLQAERQQHPTTNLGYVGKIVAVNSDVIKRLSGQGFTVVVSPVSADATGQPYNINADDAGTAIAAALQADNFDFISNVPGVLKDGYLIPTLSIKEAEQLIDAKIITDGMIPKVRAALTAVERGVKQTRIVNLAGLMRGGGTVFA
ncbi:MAG TPA: acetylglutamate kinase [Anaerolineae bacterium]|nr:acetylglutamate kinase [Anaerolineae bacterium]